jgi:hypothetical protein
MAGRAIGMPAAALITVILIGVRKRSPKGRRVAQNTAQQSEPTPERV